MADKIIKDKSLSKEEKKNVLKFVQPFYEGKYKTSYIFNGATVDNDQIRVFRTLHKRVTRLFQTAGQ